MKRKVLKHKDHIYTIDDSVLPSVTKIISVLNPDKFKYVDKDILDYKSQFGTQVHEATQDYDLGLYNVGKYNNDVDNYVKQYERFYHEYNCQPIETELSLYHNRLYYAGTIDKIAKTKHGLTLIDIKTGGFYKEHIIQIAAYTSLAINNKINIESSKLVYLTNDNYTVYSLSNYKYFVEIFKSLLKIYNFKNTKFSRKVLLCNPDNLNPQSIE